MTVATHPQPHPHRLRNILTAIAAICAVLLVAVVLLDTVPALDRGSTAVSGQSRQALDADAARLTALAEHYRFQRAVEADAARWTAQAAFYAEHGLLTGPDGLTRGQRADALRWEAQADHYLGR